MDNNAFRTLVNQQLKSTKEIAREAVESEFRQKKQKRGGRSRVEYDSDSASDDDDDLTKRRREGDHKKSGGEEVTDEPEWKRRRKEKAAATGGGQWRDRAKERREGKNLDYNDAVTTTTIHSNGGGDEYTDKKRQAELSKFLGGDEEHTHLVKGLDLALAQKVRREEMGAADANADGREEDLDQLLEDAYNNTQQKESSTLKSKQSSSIAVIQPKSELGKSVQHYLLKKQQQQQQRHNNHSATTTTQQQSIQINPTKQNSIQRSHYTFSLDSTIQKRHDAWDVPQLQMIGGGSGQQEQSLFERRGMTPLDCHLIATIRKKLDGALNKGGGGGKRKEVNVVGVDKSDDGMKQSSSLDKEVNDKEQSHQEDNLITEKIPISNLTNNKKDESDDDDSDDDIFADVGAYVPPTAVATTDDSAAPATTATATDETNNDAATTSTAAPKKQSSIFDNLITDQSNNNTEKRQPMQLQQTLHQHQNSQLNNQSKHVIDRDVFGGSRKPDEQQLQQVTKRRGPQTAALEGVSMTNYEGGYGEEMDTDFLNEDGDGYQKKKRWDDDNNDDGGKGDEGNVDADDDEED